MQTINDVIAIFPTLSMDHVNAVTALGSRAGRVRHLCHVVRGEGAETPMRKFRPWVKLPNRWIEAEGLCDFDWALGATWPRS